MYVTNMGDPLTVQVAEEAVALAEGLDVEYKRIYALALLAKAWNAPTYRLVTRFSRQCLAVAEEIGDTFLIAESLIALINTEPDLAQAKAMLDRRLMLVKQLGDEDGLMSTYKHLGDYYLNKGETTLALQMADQQIQIAQKLRNPAFGALGLIQQGHIFLEQGQIERGIQVLTQALEEAENLGPPNIFRPNIMMGYAFGLKRDWSKAEGYLQRVIEIARESRIEFWETYAFLSLAEIAHWLGKDAAAVKYYQEVIDLRQVHHSTGLGAYAAGMASLLGDDLAAAKDQFLAALKDYIDSMFFPGIGECLAALALYAIREESYEKAVRLHAAAILLRDWREFNHIRPVLLWRMVQEALERVRESLGEDRYTELMQEGQEVSIEEVTAYVQEVLDG
jgi:tetratricopeptide (TPR) repeat protein